MTRPVATWSAFALACLAVTAGLAWATHAVLRAEREEVERRESQQRDARLRLAAWRMDAWLAGFIAREAARPPSDYSTEPPGPLAAPSPLSRFASEHVAFHFLWRPETGVSSPWSALASDGDRRQLGAIERAIASGDLGRVVSPASSARASPLAAEDETELALRAAAGALCQAPGEAAAARVGPLVATWLGDAPATLVLARTARDGTEVHGLVVRWAVLERTLTSQVEDLLPGLRLVPWRSDGPHGRDRLGGLPVSLEWRPPPGTPPRLSRATVFKLGLSWLSAAVALAAVGGMLRSSMELGRRRHRFASTVTHELRTPLTALRLHADLLASGALADESERRKHLETLRGEADRLADLVEDVLEHARLESGRHRPRREVLSVGELVDRVVPALSARADAGGMRLDAPRPREGAERVRVPVSVIERILASLVDNAARHAGAAGDPTVQLDVDLDGADLRLRVRDHGPGVPAPDRHSVFAPFERGTRPSGTRGLGLGLAIARDLARQAGGDLSYFVPEGGGAGFELRLPTTRIT